MLYQSPFGSHMEGGLEEGKTGSKEVVISVIWSISENTDTGPRSKTELRRLWGGLKNYWMWVINKKEESKMSAWFMLRQWNREYHALRGKLQGKDSEKGNDQVSSEQAESSLPVDYTTAVISRKEMDNEVSSSEGRAKQDIEIWKWSRQRGHWR